MSSGPVMATPKVRLPEPNGSVCTLDFFTKTRYSIFMMKNETTSTTFDLEQIALQGAFAVHNFMLADEAWWSYDGSKDSFDQVYLECRAIAQNLVYPSLETICETFWEVQNDVAEGKREIDWYL